MATILICQLAARGSQLLNFNDRGEDEGLELVALVVQRLAKWLAKVGLSSCNSDSRNRDAVSRFRRLRKSDLWLNFILISSLERGNS